MTHDIASLVGSRICHDLISPIGAIGNGVELMEMTQVTGGAEMALINDSVENANARIRFFRIAFGSASADQRVNRTEILSILAASARGGRVTYDWQIAEEITRFEARAAFLLIQCLESALPRGGEVRLDAEGGVWKLMAHGPQLRWDAPLWDSVTNVFATVTHTPAQVQFALLPDALKDIGRRCAVTASDDMIAVTLRLVVP